MNSNIKISMGVFVALVIGLGAGYYYGDFSGKKSGIEEGITSGRQQILDEQKKAQEEQLAKVAEEANIFDDVEKAANPFRDTYKNPFAQ